MVDVDEECRRLTPQFGRDQANEESRQPRERAKPYTLTRRKGGRRHAHHDSEAGESLQSPVGIIRRSDHQDHSRCGARVRCRTPFGHDETLPRREFYDAVFEVDQQLAFDDVKELIVLVVLVPVIFALIMRRADGLIDLAERLVEPLNSPSESAFSSIIPAADAGC